jgi:hypothetical protein
MKELPPKVLAVFVRAHQEKLSKTWLINTAY